MDFGESVMLQQNQQFFMNGVNNTKRKSFA